MYWFVFNYSHNIRMFSRVNPFRHPCFISRHYRKTIFFVVPRHATLNDMIDIGHTHHCYWAPRTGWTCHSSRALATIQSSFTWRPCRAFWTYRPLFSIFTRSSILTPRAFFTLNKNIYSQKVYNVDPSYRVSLLRTSISHKGSIYITIYFTFCKFYKRYNRSCT